VGLTIRHLGVSKLRGRFARFDADVYVGASLDDTSVTAMIDLASIDTGNSDRDAHVSSPDLIDVARRPSMLFRSTRITGSGNDWTVLGDLAIGDVTQPFTIAVDFGGVESFPVEDHATPGSRPRVSSVARSSGSTSRCRRA
jgi:polyisoprenoid-binding protein YceI